MSNELVSRQAMASSAPVAMQAQTDALLARAKMVAQCPRDMLPRHYQGNPGACLLAVDWADRNDVGILEALGQVAFVHGKPVVSAVLQRKLAARAGYTTKLIEGDERAATVAVIGPDGAEVGRATYTIELAQELGIMKGSQVWKADPAHMLVLRATTRALMYYGPADLGVVLVDEHSAEAEPQVEQLAEAGIVDEPAQETPQDVADTTDAPIPVPTADELRTALKAAGIRQATALKAGREMYADADFGTFDDIAAHPDAAIDLADWIEQQ